MGHQEQVRSDSDFQSSVIFRYEVQPVPLGSVPRPMDTCGYSFLSSYLDMV